MRALVTGATGFLGSHIAEQLVKRGDNVRALVRPTSDTTFLEALGVELVRGDVTSAPSLPPALDGAEVVYHAAAMVSDWGPWVDFRRVTVNGTRNTLKAAIAAKVPRFLHVSTDGVYRYPDLARGVNETTRMETKFGWLDYYRRSKTAAEKIARRFQRVDDITVSIVRPALILGERDAAMLPGIVAFLKTSMPVYMGSGRNVLPCVYGGDVADLCIRAATDDRGANQTYIAVNPERVTQRDLFAAVAEATHRPAPKRSVPLRVLYAAAAVMEANARRKGWAHRPDLTRFTVNLIGLDYREDPSKAIQELGWTPETSMREAVRRSVEWSRSRGAEPVSG